MSNKIVPTIYRSVIDDVIQNIKSEFDEYGVSESVLYDLQSKWEQKVMASGVADFEPQHQPVPPPYPPHPGAYYAAAPPGPQLPTIKSEPVDNRYMLSAPPTMHQYAMPLPGPQLSLPTRATPVSYAAPQGQAPPARIPQNDGPSGSRPVASSSRIPQLDGPSSASGSDGDSPPASAPRSSHPSLPQPSQSQPEPEDPEAINSDLDDSDTENEEEAEEGPGPAGDIVFCTYDKVARVKNKWKCVLKDGMIHVNNKDYLFAKCTGEFEW